MINMNYLSAFFSRKSNTSGMYNYDIRELINDFSFYDFISKAPKRDVFDFGAFAVFTDKQYVIGYNAGFGIGTHYSSFARFMKDIHGGGFINNLNDANKLSDKCMFNYITAKIYYEEARNEGCVTNKYWGGVRFIMPPRQISLNQLKLFRKFYDEYNEDLKYAIKKSNGTFDVSYQTIRGGVVGNLNSLDEVLKYIEEHVDLDYAPEEKDEVILGTGLEKVRKLK